MLPAPLAFDVAWLLKMAPDAAIEPLSTSRAAAVERERPVSASPPCWTKGVPVAAEAAIVLAWPPLLAVDELRRSWRRRIDVRAPAVVRRGRVGVAPGRAVTTARATVLEEAELALLPKDASTTAVPPLLAAAPLLLLAPAALT